MDIHGIVVVVIGDGSGIGQTTSLVAKGAKVAMLDSGARKVRS